MRTIDQWQGCYPSSWKGIITPEAMSHPAKYSSRLIHKIYEHMLEEGWIKMGNHVLDPFGGVALGALDAMRLGLNWHGVELEPKFHKIGNDNIGKWMKQFAGMPSWGSAELLLGDSRFLLKVLNGSVEASISSPPFLQSEGGTPEPKPGGTIDKAMYKRHAAGNAGANAYGSSEGQLSSMKEGGFDMAVSSPPYSETRIGSESGQAQAGQKDQYGGTSGQLGRMDGDGFDSAISSPPFQESTADGGYQLLGKYAEEGKLTVKQVKGKKDKAYPSWNKDRDTQYAPSPENLGNMEKGNFEGAISSPPYETGGHHKHQMDAWNKNGGGQQGYTAGYADENINQVANDDFWMASKSIVEQVYIALAPGGHACWVVKDYVKNKEIVPFCDRWRQLCESVGFVTLHEHHAMLVHHKGTQHTLEGGTVERKTESKSFFRRLAEKKGSPRIDYETVFCMVKEIK